jgi:hypothetical protein
MYAPLQKKEDKESSIIQKKSQVNRQAQKSPAYMQNNSSLLSSNTSLQSLHYKKPVQFQTDSTINGLQVNNELSLENQAEASPKQMSAGHIHTVAGTGKYIRTGKSAGSNNNHIIQLRKKKRQRERDDNPPLKKTDIKKIFKDSKQEEKLNLTIINPDSPTGEDNITSTLDMFYWLAENPPRSIQSENINFANPRFLYILMTMLYNRFVHNKNRFGMGVKKWQVYMAFDALYKNYDFSHAEDFKFGAYDESDALWEKGAWEEREEEGGTSTLVPPKVRPVTDENINEIKTTTKDKEYIGTHFTSYENALSLIKNGPSESKFGKSNGNGKGDGFYVVPKPQPEDKIWGPVAVRVYLRDKNKAKDYGEKPLDGKVSNKIVEYGPDELVIPSVFFDRLYMVLDDEYKLSKQR